MTHVRTMDAISIVLVEPQGPINVGSVCRVMKNFGLRDLRLVNPCADFRDLPARRMALKAATILEQAAIYPTLERALADCHLAFGTTRRFGRYREDFLSPAQCAARALEQPDESRVAMVFGREDRGLHTSELDLCQHFVTIPSDDAYPSLNLSHAVALLLYELCKALSDGAPPVGKAPVTAPAEAIENMFRHMRRTLLAADFLDPQNPDHIIRAFRRLFGRTGLSDREVRILQGLWSRIDWIEGQRKKLSAGK